MRTLLLVTAVLLSTIGCRTVSPDAGHEAVLIQKPWFFGHGGVDQEPVKTGLTIAAMSTQAEYVSMQPIQFQAHFDDLMSSDGVPLDFDSVLRLQITDSVRLISKFGPNWYQANVEAEFRNRVRQAVRKHGMNETAINTNAIEEIDNEVTSALDKYLRESGVPVVLKQVTIGKANPPDSIKNQRIETAAQQQRVMTEQQRTKAEGARLQAEQARAAADNAFRSAMQMSPEQYLQLEQIKMQRETCARGGCSFIISDTKNLSPIVDTRRGAQ